MTTTVNGLLFFITAVLLTACSDSSASYETYHNQRYDYRLEYPDFLIPQGEATNQDGQKFISKDQRIELLVYRDYKNNYLTDGDLYTVQEAYEEALQSAQGVFNKKLDANAYLIEYKTEGILHTDYAQLGGDSYFNIRFVYPEKDQDMLQGSIKHVIKSLTLEVMDTDTAEQAGNASAGRLMDMFPAFVDGFLSDVYWGKNFNTLLRSNDQVLTAYIDPAMDVRRYYAPGTVAKLASRQAGFGFTQEDDFLSKAATDGEKVFKVIAAEMNPCELEFDQDKQVYYQWLPGLPKVVINLETFASESVEVVYPDAELMAVYLPNTYANPRGFYFINTPGGWKLAFVDDSLCEA
ncbi:MAG: hypothetical protein M0Q98_14455 [Pseudomonas sp.]|jgi:hypothetical protein|nr:hypothetical protein [Pseudomonas sp.]MDY0413326.1 hypothetical protein [Pseudomonas sp.]NLO54639.1 hypothetical protein [Gammaproteobacteria bacterium]